MRIIGTLKKNNRYKTQEYKNRILVKNLSIISQSLAGGGAGGRGAATRVPGGVKPYSVNGKRRCRSRLFDVGGTRVEGVANDVDADAVGGDQGPTAEEGPAERPREEFLEVLREVTVGSAKHPVAIREEAGQ